MTKHTRRATTPRKRAMFEGVQLRAERADDGGGVTVSGYAAVFDAPAHGEVIKPGAFTKTLADGADVRFLVNHAGVPLARTKSGTLELAEDDHGLRMVARDLDLANPTVAELVSALDRGDLDQMSFGFWPVREVYNEDTDTYEQREVDLDDVSAVTYPWYDTTTVTLDRALRKLHAGRPLTRAERAAVDEAATIADDEGEALEPGELATGGIVQTAPLLVGADTPPLTTPAPAGMSLAEARARLGI